jgi:SAM-dependent methyltransferase
VTPLVMGGHRVLVDGHPICAGCGGAVVPVAPGRWSHVPPGRPYPYRLPYLAPVRWEALRDLPTYRHFADRYPWAVDPEYGAVTTPEQWHEGRERLARYHERLAGYRCDRRLTGDNPYAGLVAILAGGRAPVGEWRVAPGLAQLLDLPGRRRELAGLFAWAVPSAAALGAVAGYGPVLECGAGTGYWAALLRQRGADVLACDAHPVAVGHANAYHAGNPEPWTRVEAMASVPAVRAHRSRTLLLCWPPPDDDTASHAALRAYRGDTLLYVGDGPAGPTGTVRFHRELADNWTVTEEVAIPTWPGLRDRLMVLRRNPGPRRPARHRDRCPECGGFVPTGWPGRCDGCFRADPPALALRSGAYRIEYSRATLDALPAALRTALLASPNRIGEPSAS